MALEPEDVEELEATLGKYEGLAHLRVKKWGDSLTIVSGDGSDPVYHARLTHLGGGRWVLILRRHTGRWEKTPFIGTMGEVVETLVTNFGFHLEDLSAPPRGNS